VRSIPAQPEDIYYKAQSADDLRHDIEVKEAELRTFTPVQHNVDRLSSIKGMDDYMQEIVMTE